MKEKLLREVEQLDTDYFGKRPLLRLISALVAQTASMQDEPTVANVRKQLGDGFLLQFQLRAIWDGISMNS